MNIRHTIIALSLALTASASAQLSLKETMGKHMLIGVAVNQWQAAGEQPKATDIIRQHFNQAVAENVMKGEVVSPAEGRYDFTLADEFMDYCDSLGLTVTGHCLVWHSQPPKWIFTDKEGKEVSREVLIRRMVNHINTVMGRYKGRIKGWDVVNEMVEDDGSMRKTPYYRIIGPDYIEIALKAAHAADPDAELYLNDFSMAKPGKRATYVKMINDLRAKGCRIDAIGMQSHNGMDYPNTKDYEASIEAFAATGVKVMITELDFNCLPNPTEFSGAEIGQNFDYEKKYNPYADGITEKEAQKIDDRMMEFFNLYSKHRDVISRVTLWGVEDGTSWLNDWPIKGRTNFPLLFTRSGEAKPVVERIAQLFM